MKFLSPLTTLTFCLAVTGLLVLSMGAAAPTTQDDPPAAKPLTIKEIMNVAHKDGLLKKVATGKASDEEAKKLHTLYLAMQKLPAPQGEKASWDEKNKALVAAAKTAVDKDADYAVKLKAATNCAACHKLHKP